MESPLAGSLLGPTLSCIIADQVNTNNNNDDIDNNDDNDIDNINLYKIFQLFRTRAGDRFFYSLVDSASQFTAGEIRGIFYEMLFQFCSKYSDQMSELEKVSFARILCDNSDIETMQPDAFRIVSDM